MRELASLKQSMRYVNAFAEDGITPPPPTDLPDHFARGLTTFLDARCQNFNYQLWDSRAYFKPTYTFDDTAIVIQGPIAYDNNYTAETFKLYRSIYPNAPIILSTWKGEATADFRKTCAENSVVLLENDPPEFRGSWNINMQLKSSQQGVKFVRENTAAKFVLKTRTDQRINRFEFLAYFKNLLETFPPKDDKLQRRIIFLGDGTSQFLPFHLCDFFAFGHISDITKLYDAPFHRGTDELAYTSKNIKRFHKVLGLVKTKRFPFDYDFHDYPAHKLRKFNRLMCRLRNPEVYIARNFYEKCIGPIDDRKSFEVSWEFTRDYVILVDDEAILFENFKYENERYLLDCKTGGRLASARWLDMYKNFKSVGGDERRST